MKPIWINARFLTQTLTGVQRYASEVTRRLSEVELISPDGHRPEYAGVLESHTVRLSRFRLGRRQLSGHVWEQLNLPRELPKNALLFSPGNCGPLAVRQQVVTIHDIAPLEHPEWFSRSFSMWYRMLIPLLVRRVRLVLTVSEYSRQRIIERTAVSPEKVTSIPLGVEPGFRVLPEQKVCQTLAALNIHGPYVLTVSAMSSRKNVSRLFQAWSRLGNDRQDASLIVVGDVGLNFSDMSSVGTLPANVVFLGHVSDEHLPALYNGALAFAYPSLYEGFGLPPLEAMACGTSVISSNVTSLPETVGNAALIVDPLDVDSIAEGLRQVIHNPALRQELRTKGLSHVRQFNWDNTAASTWQALQRIAKAD